MIGLDVFVYISVVLGIASFLCLYRAVMGPTVADRVVAINVIGTMTMVILVFFGYIFNHPMYIDVAFVYALISFLSTITIAKYLERGSLLEW